MKKIISVFLAVMMIVSVCSSLSVSFAADGATVTASAAEAKAGGKLEVTLSIEGNPGFAYMKIAPEYDDSVLTLSDAVFAAEGEYDPTIEVGKSVILDFNQNFTADGDFLTLVFDVAPSAATGEYEVGVSIVNAFNYDERPVTVTASGVTANITGMSIEIASVKALRSGEVEVEVKAVNNAGFCMAVFTPVFDSQVLTLTGVTSEVLTAELDNNIVLDGSEDFTEDGVIAILVFEVSEDAAFGPYDVDLILREAYNGNAQTVLAEIEAGEIEVYCDHSETETRDAVEANCTESGYSGDIYCTICGELVEEGHIVEAKGHDYDAPVFTWAEDFSSAEAEFVCKEGDSTEKVTATVTSETTDAGCEEAGETVYTATVTFEGQEYTDVKTVVIEAKGHSYGEPEFVWDGETASAEFVCGECGDRTVVVCDVESAEIVTTNENGYVCSATEYTATAVFGEKTYTDTLVVENFIYGDVDGNNVVDGKDLIRLRKYLDNISEDTDISPIEIFAGADVNGGGIVCGKDLIRLRKYLDNLDPLTGVSSIRLGPQDGLQDE